MAKSNENTKSLSSEVRRKKVIIVGSAEPTLGMTPWDDQTFDVWALAWRNVPRADAYFDIHLLGPHRKRVQPNYEQRLADFSPIPVYLQHEHPDIPNSISYPYDEIVEFLTGGNSYINGHYFCSSIAYMFALAMWKGYEEIHIYGVNLIDDEEYAHQRPNTEYLIGLARGRGHKVYIPEGSSLLRGPYLYGFEEGAQKQIITEEFLKQRIATYNDTHHEALAKAYLADGAAQEAKQLYQILRASHRGLPPEAATCKDPNEAVKKLKETKK